MKTNQLLFAAMLAIGSAGLAQAQSNGLTEAAAQQASLAAQGQPGFLNLGGPIAQWGAPQSQTQSQSQSQNQYQLQAPVVYGGAATGGVQYGAPIQTGVQWGSPQVSYQYIQQPSQQVQYRYIQQPVQQVGYRYVQQPVQQVQYRYIQQPSQVQYRYIQQPSTISYTTTNTASGGYQGWNYSGGSNNVVGYDACAEQCQAACSKNMSYYQHCYRSCADLSTYYKSSGAGSAWQQSVAPQFGQVYGEAYLQPQLLGGAATYQNQTPIPANWWFQQPQVGQWFSTPEEAIRSAGGSTGVAPANNGSNFWSFRNVTGQNG